MASIRRRGENSFQIIVSKGYDINKKKLTSTKTIELDLELTPKQAEKEVQRQAVLFEKEVENGTYLDGSKMTFAELIDKWIRDHAEKQLEDRTLHRYKEILYTRILPAIGHIKLQKLQPTHLLEFYNNLQEIGIRTDTKYVLKPKYNEILREKDLSFKAITKQLKVSEATLTQLRNHRNVTKATAQIVCDSASMKINTLFDEAGEAKSLSERTIKQHHAIIHSALQKAVEWQLLFANPADRVKPPKVVKKEAKHLNEGQAMDLLNALQTEPLKYQLMVFMDLVTGVRRGELVALKWSDIDMDKRVLKVTKSVRYIPKKGQADKQPKNETSIRDIAIPPSLVTLLKFYKLQQKAERAACGDDLWKDEDWIFTQWNGELMHVDTISKWFPEFMKRHGMEKINFHAVRHTAATLLINKGLNVKALSARLGHANTSTTMDIYSHALKSSDREAADMMENIINPKKKEEDKKQG